MPYGGVAANTKGKYLFVGHVIDPLFKVAKEGATEIQPPSPSPMPIPNMSMSSHEIFFPEVQDGISYGDLWCVHAFDMPNCSADRLC